MKSIKTGDDVIYTGETNSWTYRKDIEQYSQGWIESVILSNNETNYRVNFDNGVTAIIDSCDLISK
jgi:SH3-like domain-containing protein